MNQKSYLFFICLNMLIIILIVTCKGGGMKMEEAKVVSKIPDGFVSMSELNDREDSILRCLSWDGNIVFGTKKGSVFTLYQDRLANSDVIVNYNNKYYVNEAKFLELNEIAGLALEEREQAHNFGDTIEILGADKNYYVTITGVEEISIDDKKIYDIKFSVTADVTENDRKSIFSFVEITVGEKKGTGSNFSFIDAETVRLEMKADRKLDAIVLKSPEYIGLTYKVLVVK